VGTAPIAEQSLISSRADHLPGEHSLELIFFWSSRTGNAAALNRRLVRHSHIARNRTHIHILPEGHRLGADSGTCPARKPQVKELSEALRVVVDIGPGRAYLDPL
jgi:hypothetical protein